MLQKLLVIYYPILSQCSISIPPENIRKSIGFFGFFMFSGGLEMDLKWINVLNVVLNMFKVTIKKPERRQLIFNLFMLNISKWSDLL